LNHVEADMVEIRRGIRAAAISHEAKVKELQAELLEAYRREMKTLSGDCVDREFHESVLAERQSLGLELDAARRKLDWLRKALKDTEKFKKKLEASQKALAEAEVRLSEAELRFSVLSASRFGSMQLKYWRWRSRKRNT